MATDDKEEMMRLAEQYWAEEADYWNARIDDYDRKTTFDIRFVTIDESYQAEWDEDVDVDERWARGWTNENGYFKRNDSMEFCMEIHHRIFPTRHRLKDFRLSKSLRRVMRRNADLRVVIQPLKITEEKSVLYEKHNLRLNDSAFWSLRAKFPSGAYLTYTDLIEFSVYSSEKLLACSVLERAERSVSSLLAFWDTEFPERSLGIFTVLLEMQYARDEGFEFYYLTSYLKQHWNYQYALRFPALEFYDWDNDLWVDSKTVEADRLLDQKLDFYYKPLSRSLYECLFQIVADQKEDIYGLAVIGECRADDKNKQEEDEDEKTSAARDYELLILTSNAEKYLGDKSYSLAQRFGFVREREIEDRGAVKTLRVFYRNGSRFEFNFVAPDWNAANSTDKIRLQIARRKMKIIYDPQGILEKLSVPLKDFSPPAF